MSGLKDHQIAALVNEITARIKEKEGSPFGRYQPLREIISHATLDYLERENLRIDGPKNP